MKDPLQARTQQEIRARTAGNNPAGAGTGEREQIPSKQAGE